MGAVTRIQVGLEGWQGAPGVMTFHALDLAQDVPAANDVNEFMTQLRSMFDDLRQFWGPGVEAVFPAEARVLDIDTGNLVQIITLDTLPNVVSQNVASQTSRATMAKFQYVTDRITGNRILRGGPFFGPLGDTALTDEGLVNSLFRTSVENAHEGLLDILGPLRLAIYGAPSDALPAARWGYVQSAQAWQVPAVLRRRRD